MSQSRKGVTIDAIIMVFLIVLVYFSEASLIQAVLVATAFVPLSYIINQILWESIK